MKMHGLGGLRSKFILGILSAGAVLSPTGAARADLVGCTFGNQFAGGSLFDVNQSTGVASNGRYIGITGLVDVAYAPNGTLYAMSTADDFVAPNSLLTIDLTTGTPTVVGATGLSNIIEGDLAFQPGTGKLFGTYNFSGSNYQLFTLDLTSGAATIVGNIGSTPGYTPSDISGMAFSPDGSLYIIDETFRNLVKINPANGSVISSLHYTIDDNLGLVVGFDINPATGVGYVVDGGPFGLNGFLNSINTTTGEMTPIGQTFAPGGLSGLAFSPVPEPASLGLLAAGAGMILRRRKH